jgi:hypothetical protein
MADNSTGLSLAGIVKWILLIITLPLMVKVWQGLVMHQTTNYSGRFGALLTCGAAIREGLLSLLYSCLCFTAAWAIWYFQQRNED